MSKENLFFHYYPDRSPTFRKLTKETVDCSLNLSTSPSHNSSFITHQPKQPQLMYKRSPQKYKISSSGIPSNLSFKTNKKHYKSPQSPLTITHSPPSSQQPSFKKKIRLEDRKQRSPYPDSRPKARSRGDYSICRVPSPSFVRSGVTGECKVTRLKAQVNITEYGPRVRNNNYYNYEVFQDVNRSREKQKVNCKGEKIEFYNNQQSCLVLPANQRLRRIVSSCEGGVEVHMIESQVLSPMDSRIQFELLGNRMYQTVNSGSGWGELEEQSKLKAGNTNETLSTFWEVNSNLNNSHNNRYYHHGENTSVMKKNNTQCKTLHESFSNLSKLMQQSSMITAELFQDGNQQIYSTF